MSKRSYNRVRENFSSSEAVPFFRRQRLLDDDGSPPPARRHLDPGEEERTRELNREMNRVERGEEEQVLRDEQEGHGPDIDTPYFARAEYSGYTGLAIERGFVRMHRFSLLDMHLLFKVYKTNSGDPLVGELTSEVAEILSHLIENVITKIQDIYLGAQPGSQRHIPDLKPTDADQGLMYCTIVSPSLHKGGIHSKKFRLLSDPQLSTQRILGLLRG